VDEVFALLAIGSGLALVFAGYRLARVIIALWGFITGLALGGAIAADLSSTPLLGASLGVVTGLIVGLTLACVAYLFYAGAIIVLFSALGYWLASGFVLLMGSNFGLLAGLLGIGIGIMTGIFAIAFNAPKIVLISITSLAGAMATIYGILLITNQLALSTLGYGTAASAIEDSALWTLAILVLTGVGCVIQTMSTSNFALKTWGIKEPVGANYNVPLPPHHTHY